MCLQLPAHLLLGKPTREYKCVEVEFDTFTVVSEEMVETTACKRGGGGEILL